MPLDAAATRKVLRLLAPVAVGLLGAWLGMSLGGRATESLGPFRIQASAGFGRGVTDIGLPPIGQVRADTHLAPLHFSAGLVDIDVPGLTEEIKTGTLEDLVAKVEHDALERITPFALRLLGAATLGGLLLGLLAFRHRWRAVLVCGLVSLVAVGGSEAMAWLTFRQEAFLTPTFSGNLALAPDLIGPVQTASRRIEEFREELERLVQGAIRVYASIDADPVGGSGQIRLLHISDVHLSPLGLDFAREVAEAFDVDLIVDTGDLTSFGTPAESLIANYVPRFGRPYVFVRGNHDSQQLEAAVDRTNNGEAVDGDTVQVRGLNVYGLGDPLFTPNKRSVEDEDRRSDILERSGLQIAFDLDRMLESPDVIAVHDERMAESLAGRVPLVIFGHGHVTAARQIEGTLFLEVGTTGGAGLTVFTQEGGIPLSARVLYFDPGPPARLVAYDDIQQSPQTGSLTVKRHLISEEFGQLAPTGRPPSPSPSDSRPSA